MIAENYSGRVGKTRREKWESIYTLITFRVVQQKFSSSCVRPKLGVLYKSFENNVLACEISIHSAARPALRLKIKVTELLE